MIAGAGSTHTPGIIQSLLQKKQELPLRKLALYDIDEQRMNLVYDIMRQFIEQEAPDLDVVVTTDPETAFTDVDERSQQRDAISWVSQQGIMQGTGAGVFSPDRPLTRGMFATILARYARLKASARSPACSASSRLRRSTRRTAGS